MNATFLKIARFVISASRKLRKRMEPPAHMPASQEGATQNQRKQQFTKGDERATMVRLKEQREARTVRHRDPDWVTRYWKRLSGS